MQENQVMGLHLDSIQELTNLLAGGKGTRYSYLRPHPCTCTLPLCLYELGDAPNFYSRFNISIAVYNVQTYYLFLSFLNCNFWLC